MWRMLAQIIGGWARNSAVAGAAGSHVATPNERIENREIRTFNTERMTHRKLHGGRIDGT